MVKLSPMSFRALKLALFGLLLIGAGVVFLVFIDRKTTANADNHITSIIKSTLNPGEKPSPTSIQIPNKYEIARKLQIFQSFNNCGPASLTMLLSYFRINETQENLGQKLRPYQVASGDNDDKSVTLEELANAASDYNLAAYHRPNGDYEKIKRFVSNGIPVIVRTWLHPNEDIGHFRVIRGYDDTTSELIQDDSFEGKDLRYNYDVFNKMWEPYNYEYLVLVPKEKQSLAEEIIGEDIDTKTAWKKAANSSGELLKSNPDDIYARFNLSVAYFNIGEYKKSTEEFEKVEAQLPFRTLWYQIEPVEAYYHLGNYERVFQITDSILNNQNRAFSELYIIRGDIYKKQGNTEAARNEYNQAVLYNKNLKDAQDKLSSI